MALSVHSGAFQVPILTAGHPCHTTLLCLEERVSWGLRFQAASYWVPRHIRAFNHYRARFLHHSQTVLLDTSLRRMPSSSSLLLLILARALLKSAETVDVGLGCDSSGGWEGPSATCNLSVCGLAFPDANGDSSDALLTREGGDVFGSLGDFEFLDNFSEWSTVSGTEFANNAHLLCSLCHL